MRNSGIEAQIDAGDADTNIIMCAIKKAPVHQTVSVIGEVIDLLVLLMAFSQIHKNIFFIKLGRGFKEIGIFSCNELHQGEFFDSIIFLRGFSGCNITF